MIGHAVMLQGGEVKHLAARARGVKERITTITSYRSAVPNIYDSSYMTNIRPYSDMNRLYPEWTKYRLRKIRDEIDFYLTKTQEQPDLAADTAAFEKMADEHIEYLQRTSRQMVAAEYHQRLLTKYGRAAYYDAPRMWEKVQLLPGFEKLASSTDDSRLWMPESVYWKDLQNSVEALRLGKTLPSALGRFASTGPRRYFMGDELLRQGLNEVFLEWFDCSGLWNLYSEST